MKVIIEDLVAKHSGKKEKELPENTTIRFEFDKNHHIRVSMTDQGISIYKIESLSDQIEIEPRATNSIHVK